MAFLLPHEILTENDKALIDELYNQEGSLIKHNKYTIKLKEIQEGIGLMDFFIENDFLEKPISEERIEELSNYSEKIDYLINNSKTHTPKIRSRSITSIALNVDEFSHRATFKNEVTIWEMKDFVETINGFFEIEAEKSSYKLAWGWNHFQEKKYPKGYLCAIIKNHLKKYDVYDDEVLKMIKNVQYCHDKYDDYMESVKL